MHGIYPPPPTYMCAPRFWVKVKVRDETRTRVDSYRGRFTFLYYNWVKVRARF